MEMQYRNGDVFLRKVESLPGDAETSAVHPAEVLAYGEVTGHSHRLTGTTVERYDHANRAYVLLSEAGILTHEEHGEAVIPAGVYELIIERDYDPSIYARRVVD